MTLFDALLKHYHADAPIPELSPITKMIRKIRPIRPIKPIKPLDRMQNMRTIQPLGKTKWVSAHWRYDYGLRRYEWVIGHWAT